SVRDETYLRIGIDSLSPCLIKRLINTSERDKEEEPISELEDKIIILRVERTKPNNTIEALYIERDEAIAYRDIAIREYKAATARKSTKIPNIPILNDGKELYITPRISSDISILYIDAKDIILYLKTIFVNLNRYIEAYTIYYKLKIKPKDSFTNFLIDSPKKLSLLPKIISVIYIRNSRTYFRVKLYSTPYIKREYTPSLSTSERETLIKEGRYFNYKEYRYITYNYPKKKPTLAIATTTPTINPPYIDEIIELKANTDSGKVPT
ncbi:hypothetical protein N7497_003509, partial [Penicillium chrysogenum]